MAQDTSDTSNMAGKGRPMHIGLKAATILLVAGSVAVPYCDRHTYPDAQVTGIEQKLSYGHNHNRLRVRLSDGSEREFEIYDAEILSTVHPGKHYNIRTYGWELPRMDAHETVTGVKEGSSESK